MSDIFAISAFKDNYIWAWQDEVTKLLWVVDPGDAQPVLAELKRLNTSLGGILITHHHHDHTGGVKELVKNGKNVEVLASTKSLLPEVTEHLKEHTEFEAGGYSLKILDIPGHTLDHVAFYDDHILFAGDTLFSGGCGRIFEGTPAQMYESLLKLIALPEKVKLYCGHEYTLANLRFAELVEPNNKNILKIHQEILNLREEGLPSLPTSLYKERQYNPFLRCDHPEVIASAESYAGYSLQNSLEVFTILRKWKNTL